MMKNSFHLILGDEELSVKLKFKARAFSTQAKEKLEAVGCSLTVLPGRKKWIKPSVAKKLTRADEYFAKKRTAAVGNESPKVLTISFFFFLRILMIVFTFPNRLF